MISTLSENSQIYSFWEADTGRQNSVDKNRLQETIFFNNLFKTIGAIINVNNSKSHN